MDGLDLPAVGLVSLHCHKYWHGLIQNQCLLKLQEMYPVGSRQCRLFLGGGHKSIAYISKLNSTNSVRGASEGSTIVVVLLLFRL